MRCRNRKYHFNSCSPHDWTECVLIIQPLLLITTKADGFVDHYKARLVAKGLKFSIHGMTPFWRFRSLTVVVGSKGRRQENL